MQLYKIVFAEFERFKDEEEFVSYSFGTTNRIYKTKESCLDGIENEYKFIGRNYGIEEVYIYKKDEFKVVCFSKNSRKQVVHHYKIVEFSI